MADKKISQLPSGNLDANSIFPIVTNGITSQTSFSDLVEALDPYFSGGGQDLQGVMTEGSLYFDMVNKKGLSIQGLEGIEQLAILAGKSQVMVSKDGFGIMAGASLFSPTSNYTLLEGDVVADKGLVFTLPTSTKNSGNYTLATLDDIPSGGTQDLQSVLDNGSDVTGYHYITFTDNNGEGIDFQHFQDPAQIQLNSNNLDYTSVAGIKLSTESEPLIIGRYANIGFSFNNVLTNIRTNPNSTYSKDFYLPLVNIADQLPSTLATVGTVAPTSASDSGNVGEIRVTPTFIYTCVATNTWVRAAVATW